MTLGEYFILGSRCWGRVDWSGVFSPQLLGTLGREPGLALYFLKGILIGVFFVIDTMVGCS